MPIDVEKAHFYFLDKTALVLFFVVSITVMLVFYIPTVMVAVLSLFSVALSPLSLYGFPVVLGLLMGVGAVLIRGATQWVLNTYAHPASDDAVPSDAPVNRKKGGGGSSTQEEKVPYITLIPTEQQTESGERVPLVSQQEQHVSDDDIPEEKKSEEQVSPVPTLGEQTQNSLTVGKLVSVNSEVTKEVKASEPITVSNLSVINSPELRRIFEAQYAPVSEHLSLPNKGFLVEGYHQQHKDAPLHFHASFMRFKLMELRYFYQYNYPGHAKRYALFKGVVAQFTAYLQGNQPERAQMVTWLEKLNFDPDNFFSEQFKKSKTDFLQACREKAEDEDAVYLDEETAKACIVWLEKERLLQENLLKTGPHESGCGVFDASKAQENDFVESYVTAWQQVMQRTPIGENSTESSGGKEKNDVSPYVLDDKLMLSSSHPLSKTYRPCRTRKLVLSNKENNMPFLKKMLHLKEVLYEKLGVLENELYLYITENTAPRNFTETEKQSMSKYSKHTLLPPTYQTCFASLLALHKQVSVMMNFVATIDVVGLQETWYVGSAGAGTRRNLVTGLSRPCRLYRNLYSRFEKEYSNYFKAVHSFTVEKQQFKTHFKTAGQRKEEGLNQFYRQNSHIRPSESLTEIEMFYKQCVLSEKEIRAYQEALEQEQQQQHTVSMGWVHRVAEKVQRFFTQQHTHFQSVGGSYQASVVQLLSQLQASQVDTVKLVGVLRQMMQIENSAWSPDFRQSVNEFLSRVCDKGGEPKQSGGVSPVLIRRLAQACKKEQQHLYVSQPWQQIFDSNQVYGNTDFLQQQMQVWSRHMQNSPLNQVTVVSSPLEEKKQDGSTLPISDMHPLAPQYVRHRVQSDELQESIFSSSYLLHLKEVLYEKLGVLEHELYLYITEDTARTEFLPTSEMDFSWFLEKQKPLLDMGQEQNLFKIYSCVTALMKTVACMEEETFSNDILDTKRGLNCFEQTYHQYLCAVRDYVIVRWNIKSTLPKAGERKEKVITDFYATNENIQRMDPPLSQLECMLLGETDQSVEYEKMQAYYCAFNGLCGRQITTVTKPTKQRRLSDYGGSRQNHGESKNRKRRGYLHTLRPNNSSTYSVRQPHNDSSLRVKKKNNMHFFTTNDSRSKPKDDEVSNSNSSNTP